MLFFRAIEPADADLFYEAENDESAWADSDCVAPYSRHLLRRYAENYQADPITEGQLRLIAVDSDSDKPVGITDFYDISFLHSHAFIGVYILPHFRRRGFGAAMIGEACAYARRRLGLRVLGAKVLASNPGSLNLFERCGFKPAGVLPGWHSAAGSPTDLHIFSRLL